jgi:tRNA (guanine37-N1)-methyltransferase
MSESLMVDILTIFPEFFEAPLSFGPIKRARDIGKLKVRVFDLRKFADSPKEVDDYPYGGGSGMVLKAEPIIRVLKEASDGKELKIYLSPQGVTFTDEIARDLSKKEHLLLLCGRYKGVDERALERFDMELSVGDYILSGGEPAALVVLDAISRYLPGALGDKDSLESDSFTRGTLDSPYYTRPREVDGEGVPEALLSGHHLAIEKWRKKEALRRTLLKRPDLLKDIELDDKDLLLLEEIKYEILNAIEKLKEKKEKEATR